MNSIQYLKVVTFDDNFYFGSSLHITNNFLYIDNYLPINLSNVKYIYVGEV